MKLHRSSASAFIAATAIIAAHSQTLAQTADDGPGQHLSMTYSVRPLENDPAASEVEIEIANTGAGEIWNVNIRLDTGYLGMCPAVYQLGRISAGATKRIRSSCILLDTQIATLLIWRIDFDSEAGHSQFMTTGSKNSEIIEEGS